MDLFRFGTDSLLSSEEVITIQNGVRFYNGDQRYEMRHGYEQGRITITDHRLLWKNPVMNVELELKCVVLVEKEIIKGLFQNKSPKIIVHVHKDHYNTVSNNPFPATPLTYFKLGFTAGGCDEFFKIFEQVLGDRKWDRPLLPSAGGKFRAGIVGIERQLEKQARDTEKNISEAFQDINSLMEMAKPMVQLAQTISNKIRERQGSITDDETVQFRQHLLSLGIEDPVTKAKYGSGDVYYEKLAVEVSKALESQVKECGGMMSLVEAFCRINRARGVELASPQDLMYACHMMEKLRLPLRLREFGNKVQVLQHESFNDDVCVALTLSLLDQHESLTPEEYARIACVPFLLAKHSLTITESRGEACRDDSIEGLRFYPNKFLKTE